MKLLNDDLATEEAAVSFKLLLDITRTSASDINVLCSVVISICVVAQNPEFATQRWGGQLDIRWSQNCDLSRS